MDAETAYILLGTLFIIGVAAIVMHRLLRWAGRLFDEHPEFGPQDELEAHRRHDPWGVDEDFDL